jgi:uncharacterized protein (TIGR03086 family)
MAAPARPNAPAELLARALDATGDLVAGVRPDQWEAPTPCTGWSVRDLVNHFVGGNHMFAGILRGGQLAPPAQAAKARAADHLGDDPVAAYRQSGRALQDAFAQPGVLAQMFPSPVGTVPGVVVLHLRITELLVHGWDLARATARRAARRRPRRARTAVHPGKLADIPADRQPFAPPQPVSADAPAIDRLAACLGRRVTPAAPGPRTPRKRPSPGMARSGPPGAAAGRQESSGPDRTGRAARLSGSAPGGLAEMSGCEALGNDHAPCVGEELAHLGRADRGHPRVHPVEALVTEPGQAELVRLGGDQRGSLLPGESDAHDRLVRGNGGVDDPPDPELDMVVNQVLFGARQGHRPAAHIVHGHHRGKRLLTRPRPCCHPLPGRDDWPARCSHGHALGNGKRWRVSRGRPARLRVRAVAATAIAAATAKATVTPAYRLRPAPEPAVTAAPPTPMPSAVPSTSARFKDADAQPSRPGGASRSISREIGA